MEFIEHVYGIFDFSFDMKLSTRPEKYVGDVETWNEAEAALEHSLNKTGRKWELNPGDGESRAVCIIQYYTTAIIVQDKYIFRLGK